MTNTDVKTAVRDRSWLETARRMKGFTQAETAEAAGCSEAFYNRVEKGLQLPNVDIAVRMTDFLGTDIHNFLDEKTLSCVCD